MPAVDRCTSCHLGITDPDFVDAEQPFTTHPDLELYLTSKSPHPQESFGCTSCHDGRSRGTSFISSAHTPNTPDQKHEWEEKYSWKKIHHWLQPMMPKKYTQASLRAPRSIDHCFGYISISFLCRHLKETSSGIPSNRN